VEVICPFLTVVNFEPASLPTNPVDVHWAYGIKADLRRAQQKIYANRDTYEVMLARERSVAVGRMTHQAVKWFQLPLSEELTGGLQVCFPECRIEVLPLAAGLSLHPWRAITKKPLEDHVYLRHKAPGRWLRVFDWKQSRASLVLSDAEMEKWYAKANNPMCRVIDEGNAALIHDITASSGSTASQHFAHPSLLVC